jgi:hypothetical protein
MLEVPNPARFTDQELLLVPWQATFALEVVTRVGRYPQLIGAIGGPGKRFDGFAES